jgi:hypothetical protein
MVYAAEPARDPVVLSAPMTMQRISRSPLSQLPPVGER